MTSVDEPPGTPVGRVALRILDRAPALATELARRIGSQVDFYRTGDVVSDEDLRDSCRANLEFMFRRVAGEAAVDLAAPRETGRRRAEQGAPLAAIQSAFRLAASLVWESVVGEARRGGDLGDAELVAAAAGMWALHELFTTEMENAYEEVLAERTTRRELERSVMVEALLQGRVVDTASVWHVADTVGLPHHGLFVVVAAEVPALARQALPGIAGLLRGQELGSAWCLLPDAQIGIVSLRTRARLDELVDLLGRSASGRVGVGPAYRALATTPRSLHLARIAMVSSGTGAPAVNVFDRSPLPMLVASSPERARRTVDACFGPLIGAVVPAEVEVLLTTLQTYFEVAGSVPDAARRLACHPNTVRHRLKRVEARTGHSLGDARGSAELIVAMQAYRWLAATDGAGPPTSYGSGR